MVLVTHSDSWIAVPFRFTDWGLLIASSVIVNTPLTLPVAVGENVTVMVQDDFHFSVAPHVVAVCSKAGEPGTMEDETVTSAPVLFVKVTTLLALAPRSTPPKDKDFGE